MTNTSEKNGKTGCSEFDKCLEILYLMLDNEADEDQENYLRRHLDNCMVCFEQYKVEKQIRELLRAKCANQPVPKDLAQSIRHKILQSA